MSAGVGRVLSVLAASPAWPRTLCRTQMGNKIDLVSCEYVRHRTYDSDSSVDCTTVVQIRQNWGTDVKVRSIRANTTRE